MPTAQVLKYVNIPGVTVKNGHYENGDTYVKVSFKDGFLISEWVVSPDNCNMIQVQE